MTLSDKYALSKDELIILGSIYDWEYKPYLTIPDPFVLEKCPEYQERRVYSPVPLRLLECIFAKAKVEVGVAVAGLVMQGIIERTIGINLQGGQWRLPDNRIIRFEWNYEEDEHYKKRIAVLERNTGKFIDVSIQIEGDKYSQRASRFIGDKSFPCYTLAREGLILARQLFDRPAVVPEMQSDAVPLPTLVAVTEAGSSPNADADLLFGLIKSKGGSHGWNVGSSSGALSLLTILMNEWKWNLIRAERALSILKRTGRADETVGYFGGTDWRHVFLLPDGTPNHTPPPETHDAATNDVADEKALAKARHSDDFRSVSWFGTEYSFTAKQAACIKAMWEAWENGTPGLADGTILQKAGVGYKQRLRDVFKDDPAWGNMIIQGAHQDIHMLQQPK